MLMVIQIKLLWLFWWWNSRKTKETIHWQNIPLVRRKRFATVTVARKQALRGALLLSGYSDGNFSVQGPFQISVFSFEGRSVWVTLQCLSDGFSFLFVHLSLSTIQYTILTSQLSSQSLSTAWFWVVCGFIKLVLVVVLTKDSFVDNSQTLYAVQVC